MKNLEQPLYLSSVEAAAELSVTPATLYSYVSRGLIRSNARSRRYLAEDVRALKNRRAPAGERNAMYGDADLPVLDSAITEITPEGPLYRGTPASLLSERASFENVATMLWNASSSDPFSSANMPSVSSAMAEVWRVSQDSDPVDRAIAVLALAAHADRHSFNRTSEGRAATAARVVRLVAGAILGRTPSARPAHAEIADAWCKDHKNGAELIRRTLVLLIDHELNASTFTVRCAASTGTSLYDAVIAGLAALRGVRHGGASARGSHFLDSLAKGDARAIIRNRVALGERVPGFGHFLYPKGDPRARVLLGALRRVRAPQNLVQDIPLWVAEDTGEAPNIDYAIAVLGRYLGLPADFQLSLFAIARSAGWSAHAIEQLQRGTMFRPRARYVGPAPGRAAKR
jgi:citrate synthase